MGRATSVERLAAGNKTVARAARNPHTTPSLQWHSTREPVRDAARDTTSWIGRSPSNGRLNARANSRPLCPRLPRHVRSRVYGKNVSNCAIEVLRSQHVRRRGTTTTASGYSQLSRLIESLQSRALLFLSAVVSLKFVRSDSPVKRQPAAGSFCRVFHCNCVHVYVCVCAVDENSACVVSFSARLVFKECTL